jgi:uncharacterized protein (DUF885 family)
MSDLDQQNNALVQLLEDEWNWQMVENPLFATRCGDHRFDDRLPLVSEADAERRLEETEGFLARLETIDRDRLSRVEQLNYAILERTLEDRIAEIRFRTYRMPFTRLGGFHATFAELPETLSLETCQDYENYVSRLNGFRAFVASYVDVMRTGIQSGHVPSRIALDGIQDVIGAHVVDDPAQSLLYQPFARFPDRISPADQKRLRKAGYAAVAGSVVPGYRALHQFVVDEYLPAMRTEIAASALPDGRAYYEHCVRKYTTMNVTPEQVHETGLEEVRSILSAMNDVKRQVGFDGDMHAFVEKLRHDNQFYVETPDALLKEAALIAKRIDGELPRLFKTLPRTPYGIRPVPAFIAPQTTTAYYMQPAGDGTRAGSYYVNTYDLKSRPLYELEALTLHEAVPGHHLQIALQQELEDVPNLRRFGWVTAFGEGWALYAERLGLEMGFYEDPYSDFGRLTYSMWRACRLVVDTGMHYLGWTRSQAIDYMAEHTALSLLNIANEVDRYISWPGQALGYKMGEIQIRELRARAEETLGDRFDVRAFHEVVLRDGGIPLSTLEEHVQAWIDSERA